MTTDCTKQTRIGRGIHAGRLRGGTSARRQRRDPMGSPPPPRRPAAPSPAPKYDFSALGLLHAHATRRGWWRVHTVGSWTLAWPVTRGTIAAGSVDGGRARVSRPPPDDRGGVGGAFADRQVKIGQACHWGKGGGEGAGRPVGEPTGLRGRVNRENPATAESLQWGWRGGRRDGSG